MQGVVGVMILKLVLLAQVGPGAMLESKALTAPPPEVVQQHDHDAPAVESPDSRPASVSFRDTTFGQLFQGKKTLTPGEAVQLQFWLNAVKDLVFAGVAFIPRLLVGFIFFMVFYGIYRAARRVTLGSLGKTHIDPSLRDMLATALKWGIVGFGFIVACNQVGIQITGLLAGTAIIGLAIGLAAQETIANVIAGIVIFWDKPFKVDDWIDVDGRYGRVLRVTFRSTRVLTLDGEILVVPNTSMLSTKLTNHSTNPISRVKVPISIVYKASIDDARAALLSLTAGDARICHEPGPSVWVAACAESGVNLVLAFWIRDESTQKVLEAEYLERAKKALDGAGIEIPFPHLQLFVENTPAIQALAGEVMLRRAG